MRSTTKSAPDGGRRTADGVRRTAYGGQRTAYGGQTDEILFDILNLRPLKRKTSNFEGGLKIFFSCSIP